MPKRIVKPLPKLRRRRTLIKEWRVYRGMTQEQLGDRVGTSGSMISRIETAKQGYTQDVLELIADALQCHPSDLLMRHPPSKDNPEQSWSMWDSLEPELKTKAIDIIKILKGDIAA